MGGGARGASRPGWGAGPLEINAEAQGRKARVKKVVAKGKADQRKPWAKEGHEDRQ